ncbi:MULTISPECIES: hypothetical protein [Stenotrophomonas]|mgnify:FL=1|jgi:hypothetical protein|uniref:hypothetical protein n=1 Tax=Stenotrophomonas TaxID=40323 RepID=UPI000C258A5B|nr:MULTISPECIES: hypothetical protein [Stenotrophomonas]PJL15099.1 hypothetical protein B9Y66_08910 [Stenotrophomonas maltophilia]PTT34578.1 hypothetical protein DBR33_22710 [Stenotrophomonas sp. HMWF022]MCF5088850.1 hypothetical protein [Stenotrophomonas sp. PA-6-5C]MCX2894635.1 hypothetical protein [Stenotrophomonas lactitubi]PTS74456.1 hypothetical protein DBR20_13715 [Stenotrophomonas sp. HMWF023]
MIRPLTLLLCLAALPGTALAQSAAGATAPQASGLDLSVPQTPIRYLNDPALQQDPPGTFYGDKTGPRVNGDGRIADVTDDKVKVSGSFTTGIGYAKNYGNTHYNAATLNLSKNYTNDEGKTRGVNVNIHVSEGKGPGFFGPYGGGGYYGGGPGYWDYPPPYGW